jgi:hypothetical protein
MSILRLKKRAGQLGVVSKYEGTGLNDEGFVAFIVQSVGGAATTRRRHGLTGQPCSLCGHLLTLFVPLSLGTSFLLFLIWVV